MKESVNIEAITPDAAKAILEEQEKLIADGAYRQRKLSESTVDKYANDMRHLNWALTNQGIFFDENGYLRDGRHRLWAIVKAQVPIRMVVFRGVSEYGANGLKVNTTDCIDNGRPRANAQQLTIDGVLFPTQKCAALRAIAMLATGNGHLKIGTIPIRQMLTKFGRHLDILIGIGRSNTQFMKGALIGPVGLYRTQNPEKADQFFDGYVNKVNLSQGSPILALDAYMRANRAHHGSERIKAAAEATALALYHFHTGGKVNSIRHSSIGSEWLTELCKSDVKKIRGLLGVPETN